MKAIGYIRVSTQGQVNDGVSLDAQKAKIKAWCEYADYTLDQVFVDEGISGKNIRRKGLNTALQTIKKGDALVVYSLSRLSRSLKQTVSISENLNKKSADLVSLSEKIDTTSAAGKLQFHVMAAMNQYSSDVASETTKAAMAYKKSKGERVGTVLYGYKLDSNGKSLIKEKTEQQIIALISSLKSEGYKLKQIADQLNKDGLYTRRGTEWRHQYIHSILKVKAG